MRPCARSQSPDLSSTILESFVACLDSRENVQNVSEQQNDSKNCGGAVGALQKLGKVSDLSVRAFHKNANTAALLTQS